jgi:FKBP-type peptidyl-prolyl cis-trans isomerase
LDEKGALIATSYASAVNPPPHKGAHAALLSDMRAVTEITCRLTVDGETIEDTFARGKPVVFPFRSRPFTGGMSAGCEQCLADMHAGGRRTCTVPPDAGFGSEAYMIRNTRHSKDKATVIPPNAVLEYDLSLVRVSVPPS